MGEIGAEKYRRPYPLIWLWPPQNAYANRRTLIATVWRRGFRVDDVKTLTKADIVENVHRQVGFSKKDSSEITEKIFETIKRSLERGEYVKLSGFGKFEVRQKRKRRGRNPQTGEEIEITARKVLSFKASQLLRQALATGVKPTQEA